MRQIPHSWYLSVCPRSSSLWRPSIPLHKECPLITKAPLLKFVRLLRTLQVLVEEPSVAQTVSILRGLRERYEVNWLVSVCVCELLRV